MRIHDVFSAHPPLQGMRSTSGITNSGVWAHHPGPIEFYLLAVPYAATGFHPAGLVLGCLLLAAGMVATALWHGRLAGGRTGVAMVVIAVAGCELLLGPFLVLPWNPWPAVLGFIALMVVSWRILLGHRAALPCFVAVGSVVVQANLALIPMVLPLFIVMCAVGMLRWRRERGTVWPLPGWRPRGRPPIWRRPGVLAIVLTLALWLPALVELFVVTPNNASQVWALALDTLGSPLRLVATVVLVAGCCWCAWPIDSTVRISPRSALRWVSGLVGLGLALSVAASGATRVLYLVMALGAIILAGVAWCDTWVRSLPAQRVPPVAWAALGLLVALLIGPAGPMHNRFVGGETSDSKLARQPVEEAVRQLRAAGVHGGAVVVHCDAGRALVSFCPAVVARLAADGYAPYFDTYWPKREDDAYRRIDRAPADAVAVTIRDDHSPLVTMPSGRG
ncbi:hypothetical protein GCM10008112_07580 [Flexivirga endophytica]|nr:hypothetical protein GCM10008112_07580 [Flexivirga endophytica]